MTEKRLARNRRIKTAVQRRIDKGYTLKEATWAVCDSDWCYLSYKQVQRIYYETPDAG